MPSEIASFAFAALCGLIVGAALSGTPVLPRRAEFQTFLAMVLLSAIFGAVHSGFGSAANARRATWDLFAATVAAGAYGRRVITDSSLRARTPKP